MEREHISPRDESSSARVSDQPEIKKAQTERHKMETKENTLRQGEE